MSGTPATAPASGGGAVPDELHPRHLLVRVAEITAIIVLVAIAISALPGLDEVRTRLEGVQPILIVAIALAEVGSCLGYLLVFRSTFCARMPWALSYDIAMAEQAANALLPAGGAGGLALGVWALRQGGMPTDHIARRTVAFFVVTSAANFFALVLVGIGVFVGVLSGRHSVLLSLVPALITALGIILIALCPKLLRGVGQRGAGVGNIAEHGFFVSGEALHGVDEVRNQIGAALQDDVYLRPIGLNRLVHGDHLIAAADVASADHDCCDDCDDDDGADTTQCKFHRSASEGRIIVRSGPTVMSKLKNKTALFVRCIFHTHLKTTSRTAR